MRKVFLAALAMTPLFGGVAFAQRPTPSSMYDFASGPMAYPDWKQQWAKLQGSPFAVAPAERHDNLAGQSAPQAAPNNG